MAAKTSVDELEDALGAAIDRDLEDTPDEGSPKPPAEDAAGDDVLTDGEDDGDVGGDEDDGDDGDEDDDGDEGDGDEGGVPKKKAVAKKKPVVVAEEDEDDDEEDEQPTDEIGRMDYLQTHHPEVIFPDSAEMQTTLASYTRDENPVKRRSRPILSKYEAASVVGMRSQQIVQGSAPLVDVPTDDPIEIAQAELKAKIIPVVIRRILPDGTAEYWRISELRYYG